MGRGGAGLVWSWAGWAGLGGARWGQVGVEFGWAGPGRMGGAAAGCGLLGVFVQRWQGLRKEGGLSSHCKVHR